MLGPAGALAAALHQPLDSLDAGYASFIKCRAAMHRFGLRQGKSVLPYRCRRADGDDGAAFHPETDGARREGTGAQRWFLTLEDGDAWGVLRSASLAKRYDRFTHTAAPAPLADLSLIHI